MSTKFKISLIKCLVWAGIYLLIGAIWQLFEIIEYGHIVPSVSDSIIGLGFAWSLYKNLNITVIGGVER
jgi:hypothetical protein